MKNHNAKQVAAIATVVPTPIAATAPTLSAAQVRAKRVNAVQAALYARHVAAKQAAHAQRVAAANKAAYLQQLAALAAQYGMPAPTISAPALATLQRAPKGSGVTARARAIAVECGFDRAAAIAKCIAEGINKATAQTQYAVAKKQGHA